MLTDRELDVMNVLWDRGAATVAQVRDRLVDNLAYTTVLTVLRTLEAKGHVGYEVEGRAHLYFPRTVRREVARAATNHMIDKVFQGSADLLFARVLADRPLPPEQLRRIRDEVERRLGDSTSRRSTPDSSDRQSS